MREIRIGTPCRGGDRAARRRAAHEAAETWPEANRSSLPARMRKVWKIEEEKVRLVHFLVWRAIGAGVARVARALGRRR